MLSVHYKWRLPRRSLKFALAQSVHAEDERAAAQLEVKQKGGLK
jgi:hypothetical protein